MKKLLFLVAAMSAYVSTHAQVLYNNAVAHGLVDEGLRTSDRSEGGSWSQVQIGNMVCGFRGSVNPGAYDRLADDFTVDNTSWHLTGATFYMYQTDADKPTINGGLFEIRHNVNGKMGSVAATGSYKSTSMTDIYRVFTRIPIIDRPVQRVDVTFNSDLDPGDYFMVWGATGVTTKSGPWNPYLTKAGAQTVAGANALQSVDGGKSWMNIQDGLKNQDLPFILYGNSNWDWGKNNIVPEPCTFAFASLGLLLIRRRKRS